MTLDLLLAGLVLALGLLPFWLRARTPAARAAVGAGGAAVAAALAGLAASGVLPLPDRAQAVARDRPVEVQAPGYVTSDSCRACHPGQYATWHGSYHRTMTQVAGPESVVGDFDGTQLSVYGDEYRLFRRDGDFWVDQPGTLEPGHHERVEKRVALTTGSHHFQIYWLETGAGRELEIFQFAWKTAEARWMPIESIFVLPPETRLKTYEKGEWNKTCVNCHTTHPRPRLEAMAAPDTHVGEFGIACEACHGSAAEHARRHRNPLRRYLAHLRDAPDPSITNPQRLTAERSSQVCAACHAIRVPRHVLGEQYNRQGLPWRPGEDLDRVLPLARSRDPMRFWGDGAARTSGREYNGLVRSPCFTHGDSERGVLACSDCHTLHQPPEDERPLSVWANDLLTPGREGNGACTQCHPAYASETALVAHTRHPADSAGSDCYNCHMPNTSYGLLKATRSHEVTSPDVGRDRDARRPGACNLCHLDRSLGWSADALAEGWGTPEPSLSAEEREVAAGVLWILRGDAGQRALAAWSMGWGPAQEASGTEWLVPYLAQLLEDPYAANRFLSSRSLASVSDFDHAAFDPMAPRAERAAIHAETLERWRRRRAESPPAAPAGAAVLLPEPGVLDRERFDDLLSRRDDRAVYLVE